MKGEVMLQYAEKQEMLYKEGLRLIMENGTATCTLFQRKLAIGYEDALLIYNRMIREGIAEKDKGYSIKLIKKEKCDEV